MPFRPFIVVCKYATLTWIRTTHMESRCDLCFSRFPNNWHWRTCFPLLLYGRAQDGQTATAVN